MEKQPAKRIAIVEDDPAILELLSELLASAGHCVVYAGADPDCAQRLAADPPNLVFLDLMLPGFTGESVYSALRAHPATRDVPIIVCSVHHPNVVRSRMGAAPGPGSFEILAKPFGVPETLSMIQGVWTGKSLSAPGPVGPP